MSKIIVFRPLIEDGKEAVRYVDGGEWYKDIDGNIRCWYKTLQSLNEYPVLIMETRDDSGIKEVWEKYKNKGFIGDSLWRAIKLYME